MEIKHQLIMDSFTQKIQKQQKWLVSMTYFLKRFFFLGLTNLVFYDKSNTFKSITNGNKAPYNNGFIYSNTKTTKTS